MTLTHAYAAFNAKEPLRPYQFQRRDVGENDVQFDILYCGVCHSDIHSARNEWGGAQYPLVPGHEIVGKVTKVGSQVSRFKVGDPIGVGCMVDSCQTCPSCAQNEEQYCEKGCTFTYNSLEKDGKTLTLGGYSTKMVVNEKFAFKMPKNLPLDKAAPLLCAGITTYSPLRHWRVKACDKVGIVGLGGLGHMAVKLAVAMGAEVTVVSSSHKKREDAISLGAKHYINTSEPNAFAAHCNQFDFMLNTVAADLDLTPYLSMLKQNGTMVQVGAPEKPNPVGMFSLITKRRSLAGSLIGGIEETQEMLDFCSKHNITADIELIPMAKINEAYERMLKGDVRYRFVIDIQSMK